MRRKAKQAGSAARALGAWWALYFGVCTLSAPGCGEQVGPCDAPQRARESVLVQGGRSVQFAGQAILNTACANGTCHSSTARGAARNGAPAGLDFDLLPFDDDAAKGATKNKQGDAIAKLTVAQLEGLRARQRKVSELRDAIWQQVRMGLMPPDDSFASSGQLSGIFKSKRGEPCVRGKRYPELGDAYAQQALRVWLACGAPLVEINSGAVEGRAVRGMAGFQYPLCTEGDESEGPQEPDDMSFGDAAPVSLETLLAGPLQACRSCHPSSSPPDLKTLMGAAEMANASEAICEGKPYVKKGDPRGSFFYEVLSREKPGCGVRAMPIGWRLPKSDLDAVAAWIAAGAPLTDQELEMP